MTRHPLRGRGRDESEHVYNARWLELVISDIGVLRHCRL